MEEGGGSHYVLALPFLPFEGPGFFVLEPLFNGSRGSSFVGSSGLELSFFLSIGDGDVRQLYIFGCTTTRLLPCMKIVYP